MNFIHQHSLRNRKNCFRGVPSLGGFHSIFNTIIEIRNFKKYDSEGKDEIDDLYRYILLDGFEQCSQSYWGAEKKYKLRSISSRRTEKLFEADRRRSNFHFRYWN